MMQTFPISFILRLIFLKKKKKLSIYFSFTNEHLNECNIFQQEKSNFVLSRDHFLGRIIGDVGKEAISH